MGPDRALPCNVHALWTNASPIQEISTSTKAWLPCALIPGEQRKRPLGTVAASNSLPTSRPGRSVPLESIAGPWHSSRSVPRFATGNTGTLEHGLCKASYGGDEGQPPLLPRKVPILPPTSNPGVKRQGKPVTNMLRSDRLFTPSILSAPLFLSAIALLSLSSSLAKC